MRLRYRLLTLIVLIGCSKPKTNENQFTNRGTLDNVQAVPLMTNLNDTSSYIGFIKKFKNNNLFYTDLYFAANFNYDLYNEIAKLGGQTIFKDEEIQRTRMDIDKVGQYFDLTGLKNIDIYNSANQKLTTGQLSHIEHIEDMIESRFVAVFRVDNPHISDPSFCIGNSNNDLTSIDFTSYKDETINSTLIEFLELNTDHIWSINHYRLDNKSISTVSADTTAYIIETVQDSLKTLYKSNSSQAIKRLTVISKRVNGRPIFLMECGMPETDMLWTSVLVFNGNEYETSKHGRISVR